MLTVIGAGLPRTGTRSMKAALEHLGFGPCHHMFNIINHPAGIERWLPLAQDHRVDWEHVLEGFRSTQDWPASHWWHAQAETYPQAKVVLTVRDPHDWYASMRALVGDTPLRDCPQDLPPTAAAVVQTMTRLAPVLDLISASLFGGRRFLHEGLPDEPEAVDAFERHTANVRRTLPPERLLVFDVREGWDPLCAFLGVDVPRGRPFPRLNDAGALQERQARLMRGQGFDSGEGEE